MEKTYEFFDCIVTVRKIMCVFDLKYLIKQRGGTLGILYIVSSVLLLHFLLGIVVSLHF